MFVAASSQCFSDLSFHEACQQLTDLGFDRLEIWLDEHGNHLKPSELAAQPERFVTQYREATRLTPIALCFEHESDVATFEAVIKIAKALRITQVTVPSSPLGTPFNEEIDKLRTLVRLASEAGMRLSIKTKTGQLTEDARTAVELCQSVRGLGLTLDPSYYTCGPQRSASYDQVFPYVYHVHLRDTTKDQLQVQVGLGEVDYSRMINQLRREEYNRALSVEILPELLNGADRALELRKLRMLLETLL